MGRALGWLAAGLVAMGAASAQAGCKLGKLAEFPVTVTDSQPLTPVKLNGVDAQMLVDSGAFFSVISPAYAAQLKLHLGSAPYGVSMTGVGGEARIQLTTVREFTLAGTPLQSVDFIVGGGEVSHDAAGLIGQNVLQLGDVEYDFAGGVIRLLRPQGCGGQNLAYWGGGPVSAMDIRVSTPQSRFTVGTAFVNGVRIHVMLDSGASTSFLSRDSAARAGVRPDGPGVTFAGYVTGVGRKRVPTWIGPFDSFKIGDEEVKHTRLRIGDIGMSDIDMLLGADFLLSHHVYVATSQTRLYFTYNGGPVFDLSTRSSAAGAPAPTTTETPQAVAAEEPKDAEGFSRRGAALASRKDYEGADADFARAIALAPADPRYPLQRAEVRLRAGQAVAAMSDLDAALKLKPDDVSALILRARVGLALKDVRSAGADLAAASKAAPAQADERLQIADLELRIGRFDAATGEANLWIAAHRDDARYPAALETRCRAHALSGTTPDKALGECDAAVSAAPRSSGPLASRAMLRLRGGETERAIADADAALRLDPKAPWALYVRGAAKRRRGDATGADADLAAALALAPRLGEQAKSVGLAPAS